jgi:hypothetical protein
LYSPGSLPGRIAFRIRPTLLDQGAPRPVMVRNAANALVRGCRRIIKLLEALKNWSLGWLLGRQHHSQRTGARLWDDHVPV